MFAIFEFTSAAAGAKKEICRLVMNLIITLIGP
jgi:hypothetical protein